jgi:pimeloyl-ACP methyl ester carboxylesterase
MFYRWYDDWLLPEHGNWNVEASLPAIRCPVLVLQGKDDEYGTVAQVESICGRVSGRAESVLIPKCGHNPHHQARQRVLREMARFIAGLQ